VQEKYQDTSNKIFEAARQPAKACSAQEEELTVSRYQAMKAAASSSLKRSDLPATCFQRFEVDICSMINVWTLL
jgi:hypothetical protein